jgi:hypothetical protein
MPQELGKHGMKKPIFPLPRLSNSSFFSSLQNSWDALPKSLKSTGEVKAFPVSAIAIISCLSFSEAVWYLLFTYRLI